MTTKTKTTIRFLKAIVEIPIHDGMATIEVSDSLSRPAEQCFTAHIYVTQNRVSGSGDEPATALFDLAERLRQLAEAAENAAADPEFDQLRLPRTEIEG